MRFQILSGIEINIRLKLFWVEPLIKNRSRVCWLNLPFSRRTWTYYCASFINKVFSKEWRQLFRVGLDVAPRRSCASWDDLRFLSVCSPSLLALTSNFARTNRPTFSSVRFQVPRPLNRDISTKNGSDDLVSVLQVLREEADEDTDGWAPQLG